jgi:hypothetical protein
VENDPKTSSNIPMNFLVYLYMIIYPILLDSPFIDIQISRVCNDYFSEADNRTSFRSKQ